MMTARLLPADGGDPIELTRDITIVGRKEDCDPAIDHKSISKQHCIMVKTDGLVFIRDLGSTNGTRVNGQRVRRAALVPNDVVAFAGMKFRVALGRVEQVAPNALTQQLKADELAKLVDAANAGAPEPIGPRVEVHTNELPDVYPDDQSSQ